MIPKETQKITHIFAYGSLRPAEDPPRTTQAFIEDSIDADDIRHESKKKWDELDFKGKKGRVKGYTISILDIELPELDKREAPDYKRVMVHTTRGFDAWVYEYTGAKK